MGLGGGEMAVRDDEYTLLSELVSLDSKSLPPPGSSPTPTPHSHVVQGKGAFRRGQPQS